MAKVYFLILHVLVHLTISIEENGWIKIPCQTNTEEGVKYRRITWYKVEKGSDVLTGLVLKNLLKNVTTLYKFANHSYEVGEDNSLLISDATRKHCGTYKCTLWPPVGHYIQEGSTEYYPAGCKKPQVQAVSSKDALSANHLKFLIIPCAVLACAVVIMFVTIKTTLKNSKKKLVQTDGNI